MRRRQQRAASFRQRAASFRHRAASWLSKVARAVLEFAVNLKWHLPVLENISICPRIMHWIHEDELLQS